MQELKICEFNVENLFISMEFHDGEDLRQISEKQWSALTLGQLRRKQKPIAKVWGVAEAILDIDPDILMLVEVGGRDSLDNFNRHFLGDRFTPYFIEGNSRRSIDLGFLAKKDLGYRVEAISNREFPIEVIGPEGKYTTRFSRDIAELRVHDDAGMKLVLLLTHLKSKISTEKDFKGKDVRMAEASALANFYENHRKLFPNVPIVVGGDFNASLESLELELLRRTDLVDFHDVIGTPAEDRVTLTHFSYGGEPQPMVLDYLLVSPQLKDRIVESKSETYRYKGFYDIREAPASTLKERFRMPSDHHPLVLTVTL